MRIKISADSTCDLSPELIRENQIAISPLSICMGDKYYKDGTEITPKEIFAHVDNGGDLCSTTAVNVEEYEAVFQELAPQYDAVVHITIGSGFSSCYQNASVAAEAFPNVYVVDSQNLSTGHGLVVMRACQLAKTAESVEELIRDLNDLTPRVEASFLLHRLDYMVKGGRCSSAAALGANLLHLRPCIEVVQGQMKVVKKYRGPYEKCLANYVKDRLDGRMDQLENGMIFITHTPVAPVELQASQDAVRQYGRFQNVYETYAGCTVSCHCGPGTLGVLFIRKK